MSFVNVYVSGLPYHWASEDLLTIFSVYGPIESVKLLVDLPRETGKSASRQSKGVGFVHFRDSHAAFSAIQALNGHVPHGEARPLQVKFATVKKSISPATGSNSASGTATPGTPLGESPSPAPGSESGSASAPAASPVSTRSSPGSIGFSSLAAPAPQQRHSGSSNLLHHFSSASLLPPPLSVPAPPLSPASDEFNVYVAGFPESWAKEEILQLFAPYGKLGPIKLLHDPQTKMNRGVGFVRFSKYEEATAAIAALNNYIPEGAGKALQVKFASRKIDPAHYSFSASAMPMPIQAAQHLQQQQINAMGGQQAFLYANQGMSFDYQSYLAALQAQQAQMVAAQAAHGAPFVGDPNNLAMAAYQQYYAAYQAQQAAASLHHPNNSSFDHFQPPQFFAPPPQPFGFSQLGQVNGVGNSPPPSGSTPATPEASASARSFAPSPVPSSCLYVNNFPLSYTDSDLFDLFQQFGAIVTTRVIRDPITQASKQYGFVQFHDEAEANAAIQGLNGYQIGNKILRVAKKMGKNEEIKQ